MDKDKSWYNDSALKVMSSVLGVMNSEIHFYDRAINVFLDLEPPSYNSSLIFVGD